MSRILLTIIAVAIVAQVHGQAAAPILAVIDRTFATDPATVALGGQIATIAAMAAGTATDFSAPPALLVGGTITFGWTVTTALPIGGKIYVELPLNYFTAVDSTKVATFTGTATVTATCALTKAYTTTTDLVTCTTAAAILAAAASTMILPASTATLGPARAAGKYNLWTSTESAIAAANAPDTLAIGTQITVNANIVAGTATDFSAPPAALVGGTITFGWTVTAALFIGGKIYVELPLNYFTAVDSTKVATFAAAGSATTTTATCALTKAYTTTTDLVTCTTAVLAVATGATTMVLIASTATLGHARAAETYKLWTSTEYAKASPPATLAIGTQITVNAAIVAGTATDFTAPTAALVGGTITFGWTVTAALFIGGKIYVELPLNYFTAVDSTKVATFTGAAGATTTTATCALTKAYTTTTDLVTCTTAVLAVATGATTMILPASTVTLGPPIDAGTYKLWTSTEYAKASPPATLAIGGQLTVGVAMTITAAQDKVGSNMMNNDTITVGFTVGTAIPIGGKITLTLPKDYFLVVDATQKQTLTTPSATCTCVLTKAVLLETVDTVTCTTAGAIVAAVAQTLTFISGSVRIGNSQAAGVFNVKTSTDRSLATPPATVALGGVLTTSVAIAFATAGDKVPGTVNTGAVTLGFTVINVVPIGGQIVVSLPLNYFSAVDANKINTLTTTGSTCKCVLAKAATSTTDTVTCTVAGASVAAVAQTLTFIAGSVTAGNAQVASTYTVRTHSNAPVVPDSPVSGPASSTKSSTSSNTVASLLLITASLVLALLF